MLLHKSSTSSSSPTSSNGAINGANANHITAATMAAAAATGNDMGMADLASSAPGGMALSSAPGVPPVGMGPMGLGVDLPGVDPRLLCSQLDDLRSRLSAKERRIRMLETSAEASEDVVAEWQAKYDRLWEAHRKLQKTNHSLEDKLLRVVDKFEADRNQMTRDLASQTQKLVQAKLTVQQLRDQIGDLQSDLQLAINLLQNRPSSYLSQRLGGLPPDVQGRVRSYVAEKQQQGKALIDGKGDVSATSGRKITVPIMDEVEGNVGDDEKVSAAILAKVLEERAKERKKDRKFCIDVGTQTHGWHFPDKLYPSSAPQSSDPAAAHDAVNAGNGLPLAQPKQKKRQHKAGGGGTAAGAGSGGGGPSSQTETAEVIQILRSISMDEPASIKRYSCSAASDHNDGASSNILFQASVIRSPPASVVSANADQKATSPSASIIDKPYASLVNVREEESGGDGDDIKSEDGGRGERRRAGMMPRSATFSAKQTDL